MKNEVDEILTGICPACGRVEALPIYFKNQAQTIRVCSAVCWDTIYSPMFGPLDVHSKEWTRQGDGEHVVIEDARSKQINYSADVRTSYPIPDGYAILDKSARMRIGDKVWRNDVEKFVLIRQNEVGFRAEFFICPIRYTEKAKLENLQIGIGIDAAKSGLDKTTQVFVVTPEFYAAACSVADAFNIPGRAPHVHEVAKNRLNREWRTLYYAVHRLANLSK